MSHGSDDTPHAPANRSSGILTAKPKLRFALFAVAAVVTWVCLEAWLSLIYPEYPIGTDAGSPTWLGFALGWFFAGIALLIAFIMIRTKPTSYLFAYIAFGSIALLATLAFSSTFDDQAARLTFRSNAVAIIAPFGLIAVAFAFASYVSTPAIENLRLHLPQKRAVFAFILPLTAWIVIGFAWPYSPFNPVVHPNAPDYVADIHGALGGNAGATLLYLAILVPIGEGNPVQRPDSAIAARSNQPLHRHVFLSCHICSLPHRSELFFVQPSDLHLLLRHRPHGNNVQNPFNLARDRASFPQQRMGIPQFNRFLTADHE